MSEQQILNEIKELKALIQAIIAPSVKPWLTMKEAQEYTNKSRQTLLKMIDKQEIDGRRDENKGQASPWLISRESIDLYIDRLNTNFAVQKKAIEIASKIKSKRL